MKIAAIVGRPNVGKSTFFNRLQGARVSIVDEMDGVTRDRIYGKSEWNGVEFSIIDTGGYVINSDDVFESEIRKQVSLAIDEADVLIFMVDVTTGITDLDESIADMLRRSGKQILLAVNKVDNALRFADAQMFYALGFENLFPISSTNGSGTGELLDALVKQFPKEETPNIPLSEASVPKVTFVGRPNAGKSTLVNALLGEDRNIVTDIPGTTRDAINSYYNKYGHEFILVDTAGIRRKSKVHEDLEYYSVVRSIRAIEQSDVVVLLIDATVGITAQDLSIFSIIRKNNKGIVILINKWDLVQKETNTMKQYKQSLLKKIAPFTDVPVLFISALKKQRIYNLLSVIQEVYENKNKKIPTSKLNEVMLPLIAEFPPPMIKDKRIKIKYISQLPTRRSVSFAFFANLPQYIRDPYKRFLENKLREHFHFTGVPINIILREK